jgi:hypothetical protein
MSRSIEYSCYACFEVGNRLNSYPIRDAEHHLATLLSLKKGDVLYIKGLGQLQVSKSISVVDYDYVNRGVDGLYQQISIPLRYMQ